MDDLVVDTNVLVHTQNPDCDYFASSVAFVGQILNAELSVCVDKGFDLDESKNRSLICYEYLKHLVFGSPGYTLVVQAASSGRIKEVERRGPRTVAKKIDHLLSNKHDRTFANVAYNSNNKLLVSHDFGAFSEQCRQDLKSECGIFVCTAEEYDATP